MCGGEQRAMRLSLSDAGTYAIMAARTDPCGFLSNRHPNLDQKEASVVEGEMLYRDLQAIKTNAQEFCTKFGIAYSEQE